MPPNLAFSFTVLLTVASRTLSLLCLGSHLGIIVFKKCRAIQVLRTALGGWEGVKFSREKRYEGVRFNVISVTRGWVGVQIPGKKRYITLE